MVRSLVQRRGRPVAGSDGTHCQALLLPLHWTPSKALPNPPSTESPHQDSDQTTTWPTGAWGETPHQLLGAWSLPQSPHLCQGDSGLDGRATVRISHNFSVLSLLQKFVFMGGG